MTRFVQVLALGAATLVFTAAGPGIAAADPGNNDNFRNAPRETPQLNRDHRYREGRHHGKRRVGEKRRRHHAREHRRQHRHARKHRHHRHWHYARRHRHYAHRHYHGVWPRIGLHVYRSFNPPPPAYLPPPAYQVQPATAEQKVADAGHPSTCLMTREYQTEILVGGELVPAYGRACLQPDGSWYRGPAVPAHH